MTKGPINKSGRGGHGRPLSQKTLNMQKKNQFAALEGVSEGSVQKMISEFTVSKTNKKRPLSPEKSDEVHAKKPNREGNPNLIPLGKRPPQSSSANAVEFSTKGPNFSAKKIVLSVNTPSPITNDESYASITNGSPTNTDIDTQPISKSGPITLSATTPKSHDASYAAIANGAPTSTNNANHPNRVSGPKEASASALCFDPKTVQLCDVLNNCNVEGLKHVFDPLISFIETCTRTIDTQAEKLDFLNSQVSKQSEEISFLRSKLVDLENGVKSSSNNPEYHRLKSEKSMVKEQFEKANKTVRIVNIKKKGRSNRNVISDTLGELKTENLPLGEPNCFSHSDSDLCTLTLSCRSVEEKAEIENRVRAKGLLTRNHVPRSFVRTLKELRDAYLCNDFKGAVEKNDRLIMIRTNKSVSGFQVHMKSKKENMSWKVIEYINFPTSLNCIQSIGGRQTMKSSLIDLSSVYIPTNF